MEHSSIGPSGWEISVNCAGSRDMKGYAIGDGTSTASLTGNCAHEVGDGSLSMGVEPHHFIGQTFFDVVVTEEMADYVKEYTDYCRSRIAWAKVQGYEVIHKSEVRVDLSWIHPICFGTTDFQIVILGTDYAETIDLKYGRRVVYPENNLQCIGYALGLCKDYPEVQQFKITIVQPRGHHIDGTIRSHTHSRDEMALWTNHISTRLHLHVDQGAEAGYTAGEHCRDCKGFGRCSTASEHMADVAATEFLDAPMAKMPLPGTMTPEQIDRALRYEKIMERWFKELHIQGDNMARKGCQFHSHKLVEKYKRREVKPGAMDTLEILHGYSKAQLYKPKELTVNQLREAGVKKEHLNPLLAPIEKTTTLVSLKSAGSAISVNPSDMFEQPAILPKDAKK